MEDTLQNLKQQLARSILYHLSSLLNYKYGISNSPLIEENYNNYSIAIDELFWEEEDQGGCADLYFKQDELIEIADGIEDKARELVEKIWKSIE